MLYVVILGLGLGGLIVCPGTANSATTSTADSGVELNVEDPEIVYVEKGEVAPFAGDLFPPIRSIRLGLRLEQCAIRALADLTRATRSFEVELKFERKTAYVQLDAERDRRSLLEVELETALAWYRSPLLWAMIGGLVVLAAGAAAGYVWSVGR